MYKCKVCGKEFDNRFGLFGHCSIHSPKFDEKRKKLSDNQKARKQIITIVVKKICERCGKEFDANRLLKNGVPHRVEREKRFCDDFCAHARKQSKETKGKLSNTLRIKSSWYIDGRCSVEKCCSRCGQRIGLQSKIGLCKSCLCKSQEYRDKISNSNKGHAGGYREGSVKNYNSGRYDGIWFDSSWELAYYLFHVGNNIPIERNREAFEYDFENGLHKYYPDFRLGDGSYVEIKGFRAKEVDAKINQFPKDKKLIIIEGKKQMNPFLKWAEMKYGRDFWKSLYI
jgi:hypothetical protein